LHDLVFDTQYWYYVHGMNNIKLRIQI
jgi:hypothetical protein